MAVVLVVWLICGVIGIAWGHSKGRTGLGFVLGFFLGLIGLLIFAFVKPRPNQLSPTGQALREIPANVNRLAAATAESRAAPAPASIAEELARFGDLREKGLITEDEFLAQKARLLGTV